MNSVLIPSPNNRKPKIQNLKLCGLALGAALLALCWPAEAQQARVYKIAFLSIASSSALVSRVEAFKLGLRELGYIEGQNITIEYRWAEGKEERLPSLVADLLRLKVDVFVTHGTVPALAARDATRTIPIVFISGDPLGTGLVASLARPGRNLTGVSIIAPEVSGKRLELLREIVPRLARVAVLWNPSNPVSGPELRETEGASRSLGLQLQSLGVRDPDGFDSAFSSMKRERAGALIVLSDAMFFGRRRQIADLAATNRLPAIAWTAGFAEAGGLISYGPNDADLFRRPAVYVDKILKGTKPGDLPVEQPVKFDLVINLKTAKALGLTIPPEVLFRATEVIK